jgi:hypothetical protein
MSNGSPSLLFLGVAVALKSLIADGPNASRSRFIRGSIPGSTDTSLVKNAHPADYCCAGASKIPLGLRLSGGIESADE